MNKELVNLLLFFGICCIVYIVFRNLNFNYKEGMTSDTEINGIGTNAASHALRIKNASAQLQDSMLIGKYRDHYESSILHLDDHINHLMLKTALSYNHEDPHKTIEQLNNMHKSKDALNSVMSFIDKS
jgi:primase-polymerase (primpol)-like protein